MNLVGRKSGITLLEPPAPAEAWGAWDFQVTKQIHLACGALIVFFISRLTPFAHFDDIWTLKYIRVFGLNKQPYRFKPKLTICLKKVCFLIYFLRPY